MWTTLHKRLLTLCAEDHVGLWFAMVPIEEVLEGVASKEIREKTLAILHDLLSAGLIQAGFPTADGRGFESWTLSSDEIIQRIDSEWEALGREPSIGEIVWFTTTKSGDKVVNSFTDPDPTSKCDV